jgi:hypothetical protein
MPLSTSPVNFNPQSQCTRCQQFTNAVQWCVGLAGSPEQITVNGQPCPFVTGEHLHLRCNNCGYADDLMWPANNPRGH